MPDSLSDDSPFPAFYDALPIGVVLADSDDGIVFVNREFFSLTECTRRDLEFMNFQDVLSVFCLGLCAKMSEISCPEDKWHNVDRYIARQDGSSAWVRIHLSTVRLNGRDLQQLLVEDITRYRELIDSLLNRKKLYQSIVEKRPDPICCFLPDWSLTYANGSCRRCFGKNRHDIVGENLLLLLTPEMRERFAQAVASITLETPVAEIEQRIAEFEERPLWIRWVVQGFFYKTGHIKDYQAVGMDITDQKDAESRFIHANRLVSLGSLVSEVAHEINNPNNFIMLNAPLLMDLWWRAAPALERALAEEGADVAPGMPPSEIIACVPQLLQGVIEGSNRINGIVRELKTFARQDNDSGFELLSVNEIVQSVTLLMNKTIAQRTRRFSVSYGSALPLVRGRRQRLEQIVVNLLQNACHALTNPEQTIAIETRHDEVGGAVRMVVRDEGVGIKPEDLPLVTEPFYSTRRGEGGTGLGLSISLSIAREHGGKLLIESAPGEGTQAVVSLPVAMP